MDWQSIAIGGGFLLTGWAVKSFLVPFYVRFVDNRKVRKLCYQAAKKADEYGDKKLGKDNFDALQSTIAMTAGSAFVGACEGSGLDPRVTLEACMAIPIEEVKQA